MDDIQFGELISLLDKILDAIKENQPGDDEALLLIAIIKQKFNKQLEAKTGWGRNEVKQLLENAIKESLMEE